MINYILLFSSITLETLKNLFSNNFSKTKLKNNADLYKFSFFMYVCSFLAVVFIPTKAPSFFTIILALSFSICLATNHVFFIKALGVGPLSFTNFIQGLSLLIPTAFGILFLNENASFLQLVALIMLVLAMFLILEINHEKKQVKWWVYSLLAMTFLGFVGIIQSLHQISDYKSELISFLKISFMFTAIIYLFFWQLSEKKERSTFQIKSTAVIQAVSSGVFMSGVHIINLYLAGELPKIIFFPIANGGLILLNLICSGVILKEKISVKQWIGMLIGTAALCLIGF